MRMGTEATMPDNDAKNCSCSGLQKNTYASSTRSDNTLCYQQAVLLLIR